MLSRNHWLLLVVLWIVLVVLVVSGRVHGAKGRGDYYSVQERRMPCGRIIRREVVHENDAWRKTVTLLDPTGRVLATKTRTVEPEQCAMIRQGQFVAGLWKDCMVEM